MTRFSRAGPVCPHKNPRIYELLTTLSTLSTGFSAHAAFYKKIFDTAVGWRWWKGEIIADDDTHGGKA